MEPELLRLIFDGGFGLVALYLLNGVAHTMGQMQATLSILARRVIGGEDDQG